MRPRRLSKGPQKRSGVELPAGVKPAALKRNPAHFVAEKLSQQQARLERLALVAIESESDLPPVRFRSAWHSEKPE